MAQQAVLGRPGRSAGVDQSGDLAAVRDERDVGRVAVVGEIAELREAVVRPMHEHQPDGLTRVGLAHVVEHVGRDQQGGGLRLGDQHVEARAPVVRVDEDRPGPDLRQRDPRDQRPQVVPEHDGHPVARAEAEVPEGVGHPVGQPVELLVREHLVAESQQRPVSVAVRLVDDQVTDALVAEVQHPTSLIWLSRRVRTRPNAGPAGSARARRRAARSR